LKTSLAQVKTVYGQTLVEMGKRNKDIFVVEADLMKASGSKPFKEAFPDRHINVGIAEQNLVGVAAGIASTGRIPFACTMANFMAKRACDQVAMSAAYNNFNVKLIGCYAGLTQEKNGGTHISIIDLAVMRGLPNMKVIAPGDLKEFKRAVEKISEIEGPVYLRMPKLLKNYVFPSSHVFEIGKAYQFGKGTDITVAATGLTAMIAFDSVKALEKAGIKARMLHIPTLKPSDREAIVKCAKETGAFISVEDHSVYGGLGSMISEIVTDVFPVPVYKLGLNDTFGLTANLDFQLQYFGLTVDNIVETAKKALKNKNI